MDTVCCLNPFSYYNKVSQTGIYKQQTFISQSSGRWSSRHKQVQCLGSCPLSGSYMAIFLLCPHKVEGIRDLSGVSSQGYQSIHNCYILVTSSPHKGPTSKYYYNGHWDLTCEFWGEGHKHQVYSSCKQHVLIRRDSKVRCSLKLQKQRLNLIYLNSSLVDNE